jgi:uncharacterized protein (DUF608 family)
MEESNFSPKGDGNGASPSGENGVEAVGSCCADGACTESGLDRRAFVKLLGFGAAGAIQTSTSVQETAPHVATLLADAEWPSLRHYDSDHLDRVALPLGGIGTGTVSLGGRGDLRDWEIMNRPAKGFTPSSGGVAPFFCLFARRGDRPPVCRLLEGPLDAHAFEGSHGSPTPTSNLPRFRSCDFASAYPFGRVRLSDPDVPLEVHLKAFNPLIPADADASGIPMAVFAIELRNENADPVSASVCLTVPNFIGIDGSQVQANWKGDLVPYGAKQNRNAVRTGGGLRGMLLSSEGVSNQAETWGTIALAAPIPTGAAADSMTHRTAWAAPRWGVPLLDFWNEFSSDGRLTDRQASTTDMPVASLAVAARVSARSVREVTFLLGWHFPNRLTWTRRDPPGADDLIGNYYAHRYADAWEVVAREWPRLPELRRRSVAFVRSICSSSLPRDVREAALFNLSTLRTQTCFRTPDGRFFGFEGSNDRAGCCHGSCTHVWNYEQATGFLFGELAWTMREVEFAHGTDDSGLMSFRINLPLSRAPFGKAAADGQMGCLLKLYRDWQLSGHDDQLRRLWPKARKALEFCWIPGGWDADRDGVMEGCQHNTMDVEYYGPNPQMGIWYLGALRAAEEMARHLGDTDFAGTCRALFERGRAWIDANLFNGEYYEHQVRPPASARDIAPSLLVGMGAADPTKPDFQLANGCLVDQLVGQYMAHVCGLGYLVDPAHVRTALRSIVKYNTRTDLHGHFNNMRAFALGGDSALLMASYPKGRPDNPFPYFAEAMTGFEYTAAAGLIFEGAHAPELMDAGLQAISFVRARYDGQRRNPFDEAECGHHYARAMASWAAIIALTGFHYSGVSRTLTLGGRVGRFVWSSGYAWGEYEMAEPGPAPGRGVSAPTQRAARTCRLMVSEGTLALSRLDIREIGAVSFDPPRTIAATEQIEIAVPNTASR